MRSASHRAISHSSPTESSSSKSLENIRCGPRHLPFPSKAEYVQYLDFFFNDINPCHPCLNEADFRSRCQSLLTTRIIDPSDVRILALNYILFACTDILVHVSPVQERGRLPGWRWYLAADELMQKRKISGRGDLSLAQFLVYEVSRLPSARRKSTQSISGTLLNFNEALYLTHADKANAAYNVAGLACRLSFQFGLHQQRLWGTGCSPFLRHMRQRLFWTIYFIDRRISLSCGRPYGVRDSDIDVDLPAMIDDKACGVFASRSLPDTLKNRC